MFTAKSPNIFHLPAHLDAEKGSIKVGIFDRAASLGLEELHFKCDAESGLKAIIAIHSTRLGPALGGTRCLSYPTENHAVEDAMRLARGMSYKSAFAGLHYGGGKGVLICPKKINNPDAYFESYGEFIDSLNGRFITAVDVGTRVQDMDIIVRKTKYVLSTSINHGDPSLYTANSVLRGIFAAVKIHLHRKNLEGVRIAIQGVGKVGMYLAKLLHRQGAILTVSDINPEATQRCVDELGATQVKPEQIIDCECDVLTPCALGSIINADTLSRIRAKIICGAANNQLAADIYGDILYQKGIFYVPDYVVNAGGLIHVIYGDSEETKRRIKAIQEAVVDIYNRSKLNRQPSHRIADMIAEKILSESRQVFAQM